VQAADVGALRVQGVHEPIGRIGGATTDVKLAAFRARNFSQPCCGQRCPDRLPSRIALMAIALMMLIQIGPAPTATAFLKQETAAGLRAAARAGATPVLLTFAEFVRIGLPPENNCTIRSP